MDTIEKLEVLMLMREQRDAPWTDATVAETLRLPLSIAEEATAGLRRSGLVEGEGAALAYRPRTAELAGAIEELARLYSAERAAVLLWMNRNALARIRRAAADAFADAFRLKRREHPGGRDA